MSKHHAPVTRTADTECAAYLYASGLPLLRIEADDPTARAMFVFLDRQEQGRTLRLAFARDDVAPARSLLGARRKLVRGVKLAQASPARCITGHELAQHWAEADAARRQRWAVAGGWGEARGEPPGVL